MSSEGSRKRPRPPGDNGDNAKVRKKARLNQSIAGISLDNTPAGPVFVLNVESFFNARSEEIKVLSKHLQDPQNLEEKKKETGNWALTCGKRTFQILPKHMRRRTMSHNPSRMPRRLRAQALREMDPKENEKPTRHRRRFKRFLKSTYAQRQRDFKWLETHIWHAKRFHMKKIWNFNLGVRPTARGLRANYKNARYCVTAHDASYWSCLQIKGSIDEIHSLLDPLLRPSDSTSSSSSSDTQIADPIFQDRFLSGDYQGSSALWAPDAFPFDFLGPITFLWNPSSSSSSSSLDKRKLWIWAHPSVFDQIFDTLLSGICSEQQSEGETVEEKGPKLKNLKEKLLRFKLTGPKSHATLCSVLQLASDNDPAKISLWEDLKTMRSCSEIPDGTVLALRVEDPRRSFSPVPLGKYISDLGKPSEEQRKTLLSIYSEIKKPERGERTKHLAHSEIWSSKVRAAHTNSASDFVVQQIVNQEKAFKTLEEVEQNEASKMQDESEGQAPKEKDFGPPQTFDVLLIQRPGGFYEALSSFDNNPLCADSGIGSGWDVILPASWGMSLWKSLIHCGCRAVGVEDDVRGFSERLQKSFPEDYPDTEAYKEFVKQREIEKCTEYFAKPPAKRPIFDRLNVLFPFSVNWLSILQAWEDYLSPGEENQEENDDEDESEEPVVKEIEAGSSAVSSVEVNPSVPSEEEDSDSSQWFVVREKNTRLLVEHPYRYLDEMQLRGDEETPSGKLRWVPSDLWASALVEVRIEMIRRGTPELNAMIAMPVDADFELIRDFKKQIKLKKIQKKAKAQAKQKKQKKAGDSGSSVDPFQIFPKEPVVKNIESVKAKHAKLKKKKGGEEKEEPVQRIYEPDPDLPSPLRATMGFVTTGMHSYSCGKGVAIGYCSLLSLQFLASTSRRLNYRSHRGEFFVLLRNTESHEYMPAHLSVFEER